MNTRCIIAARVAAFIVMVAALFLAPASGHAQAIDCRNCKQFTIVNHKEMNCAVTVCYRLAPIGIDICKTLSPGDETTIPCDAIQAWVSTCSGPYYLIPADHISLCSRELRFAVGCCGKICNAPSPTICTRLEIQPLPCASLSCP